ncbi:hypothetical protein HZC31_03340 [Candidatus Woesearchaeota archaeon]|nr:hypothetical protein [Candidatus Woesearchaeota archaeon]
MIRKRTPDKFKAQSMVTAAETEIKFTKTIEPTKESASTIVRNVYESFRMLGDALLLIHGKEASGQDHHVEMINELFTLKVDTKRPVQVILNLKNLRHKVNYQGYIPSIEEAKDAMSIIDACFQPVLNKIKEEINKL